MMIAKGIKRYLPILEKFIFYLFNLIDKTYDL